MSGSAENTLHISPTTPAGYKGMKAVYLSHVSQLGQAPTRLVAYQG
jgi:hypothetical protein